MENYIDGFLIRAKPSLLEEIQDGVQKLFNGEKYDLHYQMYFPNRLVLGNFKQENGSLELDKGDAVLIDSLEDVEIYKKGIDAGTIEVVEKLSYRNEHVSLIEEYCRKDVEIRGTIKRLLNHPESFFSK